MPTIDLDIIRKYFSTQPVSKAWLFGSFARGEQTEDSDVDLLVALDENVGLFKFSEMYGNLKDLLNRQVDLVPQESLYPDLIPYVDADKILIYERGC